MTTPREIAVSFVVFVGQRHILLIPHPLLLSLKTQAPGVCPPHITLFLRLYIVQRACEDVKKMAMSGPRCVPAASAHPPLILTEIADPTAHTSLSKPPTIVIEPPPPIMPSLRGRYRAPRMKRCTFALIT
jgi:hypothetical protein